MEGVNANLGHGDVLWWEAMGGIKSENLKTSRRYSHCTYRPAYMGQCLVRADVGEDRWSYITCNVGLLAVPGPARLWNRLTFSFSWGDNACTLPKYLLMLKLILQAVCFAFHILYVFKNSNAMQQVSNPTRKWELNRWNNFGVNPRGLVTWEHTNSIKYQICLTQYSGPTRRRSQKDKTE